jgi:glyoxylate reductase
MSSRPRVYVTGPIPHEVLDALRGDFVIADDVEGVDGVLSLIDARIDEAFLDRAGAALRVVANYGVGVDNVDLDAARGRGIAVSNTPDVLTQATAELAVALMLALLRRVAEGDRLIRSGTPWTFSLEFMLGESLSGKRLLVVGPGRIGRATARLAEAFGAHVAFAGRDDDLASLLRDADIVSLHCPLTPSTRHLIDAAALAAMPSTAILVNTARGPVVDERALVDALASGAVAGAALDVFEFEPAVSDELRRLDNVVLTPHLGSATRATRVAMGLVAVDALRAVLVRGAAPATAVV